MLVDSYRFLPRSFVPLYSGAGPAPGDDGPVWTPFPARLAEARIALLTSAGLYLEGEQAPFDGEREKAEPTWGDPTHRVLPAPSAPLVTSTTLRVADSCRAAVRPATPDPTTTTSTSVREIIGPHPRHRSRSSG